MVFRHIFMGGLRGLVVCLRTSHLPVELAVRADERAEERQVVEGTEHVPEDDANQCGMFVELSLGLCTSG